MFIMFLQVVYCHPSAIAPCDASAIHFICNMVLIKFPSCSFREAIFLWWTRTSWNQLTHPPVFPKSESWLSGLRRMVCNSFALFLTLNPRIFIFLAPAQNTSTALCCIYYFVTGNKFPYWSKRETLFNKLLVKINSPENLLLTCLTCSKLDHWSLWELQLPRNNWAPASRP